MPKIQFKEETLNGRAAIIAYADREYLTLRIPRGDKKYSNISLGTSDLKVAHDKALDIYASTINQPLRSRNKKFLFATACKEFLEWKEAQAQIGEIKESAVKTYAQRIHQRIIPYAKMTGVNRKTSGRAMTELIEKEVVWCVLEGEQKRLRKSQPGGKKHFLLVGLVDLL